ncbi:UDP-N-acetylmuramate dehydrogenase [Shewanella chilikensis]|uniref:UDP-N-acetylmuramate dehydrogenase n=1 Tax=Shewanella chilikensis TaxID=558541 RepID=UPI001CD2CEBD|nr:UDP-N-acetylmuramate dehydrogenase [Shewanella chilikensis]MCA0950239.1 UDP-N-acetylmuramate dehydrogenase [Shewanella chilikensis]
MKIIENYNLQQISFWKIGGVAKFYIEVDSAQELNQAFSFTTSKSVKAIVIGNATNLLFSDGLIDVAIIRLGVGFKNINVCGDTIEIGAGVSCQKLVRVCQVNALVGLEHIVGIPATIGGLIYMNGGSQRKTISENVLSVTSINDKGKMIVRTNKDCKFSYRKSIFQSKCDEVIISAKFTLERGSRNKSRKDCLQILKDRNSKFPRKLPSCGSVFISDPNMYNSFGPPGKIIESLGFKGVSIGDAEVSKKHANFIVNKGQAKAEDVLKLVVMINDSVKEKYGFLMTSEGLYINKAGEITPLHLAEV